MELDELEILVGQAGAGHHGHAVTRAGVGRSAAEVGAAVTTGGQDGVVGEEAVERAVLLVVGQDTAALAILHDQVDGEVLDEVVGVVPKGLAVESVEERVAGTIGGGAAAVGLATLAEVLGLATEGTLVAGKSVSPPMPLLVFTQPGPDTNLHLSILGSGEGAAVVLEFDD